MNKIITSALLLSAGTMLSNAAETLLSTDFTSVSELPSGWTTGQWNGWNTPHFSFSAEKGANVAQPWKQNSLESAISMTSGDGLSYVVEFTTYASTADVGAMFYLSSSDYSIVIGSSYNSNNYVSVGYLDAAVDTKTSTTDTGSFVSFQSGTGTNPTLFSDGSADVTSSGSGLNVGTSLSYRLEIEGGLLSLAVSDGTTTWSKDAIAIAEDFAFDGIGFILDGNVGTVGVKNVTITAIPEPSAFGLLVGVGALALVASRRRRTK